mmetsp:Transcript_525/g.1952  ORF Transcript_525/g.1952 Transcript_525/m.1952 type:complete len:84 (+) Transcript_525:3666-3917(+)
MGIQVGWRSSERPPACFGLVLGRPLLSLFVNSLGLVLGPLAPPFAADAEGRRPSEPADIRGNPKGLKLKGAQRNMIFQDFMKK